MRTAFLRTLEELGAANPQINLIVGDLGFTVVEPFIKRCPNQFLNVGVAEQNMTGIAAGMALSGKIVFTYSIANFPTLRCIEQIRNDGCYHKANLKVVSVGGGFSYGALGSSHHATEDLAVMRALPEMIVVAPGDPVEAEYATRAIAAYDGPCYLRLGKAGEPEVHSGAIQFELGKAIMLQDGKDVSLISTGGMLYSVMQAATQLNDQGISTRVLSMHTIKPIDIEAIRKAALDTLLIVTVEEHSIIGGLGGAVAETLAQFTDPHPPLHILGVPDQFCRQVGGQEYLRQVVHLGVGDIIRRCRTAFEAIRS
jgi:transketolase